MYEALGERRSCDFSTRDGMRRRREKRVSRVESLRSVRDVEHERGVRKVEGMFKPEYPLVRRTTSRSKWLEELEGWLGTRGMENLTTGEVAVVEVARTMWEVDTRETVEGLRLGFLGVWRTNGEIRAFAGAAAAALERSFRAEFAMPMVPTDRLHQRAFYCAHLRTEADTVDARRQTPCSETECGLNWTTRTDA
jgi:hypothetical protein